LLFGTAVKLNKFSTKFEDDNLLLNIDGVVRAKWSYSSYTIKKKEVQVKQKKRYCEFWRRNWRNTQLNTPAAKANLLFQNKRKCNFRVMIPTKQFGWGIISLNIKGNKCIFILLFIKYWFIIFTMILYVPSKQGGRRNPSAFT
jgi:hypothetical protein